MGGSEEAGCALNRPPWGEAATQRESGAQRAEFQEFGRGLRPGSTPLDHWHAFAALLR